jgi:hypothetical protein
MSANPNDDVVATNCAMRKFVIMRNKHRRIKYTDNHSSIDFNIWFID